MAVPTPLVFDPAAADAAAAVAPGPPGVAPVEPGADSTDPRPFTPATGRSSSARTGRSTAMTMPAMSPAVG